MSKQKDTETDRKDPALEDTEGDAQFGAEEASDTDGEISIEPPVDTAADTASRATDRKKGGSGFVSWLALVVACIALAAFAYDFIGKQSATDESARSENEVRELATSLESTRSALTTLEQEVATSSDGDAARSAQVSSQLDTFSRQVDDRLRQMNALPGRLSAVEASLASVQGVSAGARAAWLLAEAEYYMQIANAQMQLANNPTLAATALAYADERIVQLGDPRLTGVRQALSDELRALESLQTQDTAGITLTLASLAKAAATLPLRQETVSGEASPAESDPAASGIDRALATVRKTFNEAVSVRRADEAMQPLIAPEALYFLRTNLALQMQIARLAILRNEEEVFQQSLDDVDAWLTEYYDLNDSGVRNARTTLREIRDSTVAVTAPDLSASLRLLRQFNATNTAVDTTTVDEPEQEQ